MDDKLEDSESAAPTLRPKKEISFSQKPTPLLPSPIILTKKKNWDILTVLCFSILILIAIILFIYVNHPFKDPVDKIKIIYSAEPVFIVAPATTKVIEDQKVEPILSPINSVQPQMHMVKKNKKIELQNRDYGI